MVGARFSQRLALLNALGALSGAQATSNWGIERLWGIISNSHQGKVYLPLHFTYILRIFIHLCLYLCLLIIETHECKPMRLRKTTWTWMDVRNQVIPMTFSSAVIINCQSHLGSRPLSGGDPNSQSKCWWHAICRTWTYWSLFGGWFSNLGGETSFFFWIFTPKIGEVIQFDSYFQMAWFNHQLEIAAPSPKKNRILESVESPWKKYRPKGEIPSKKDDILGGSSHLVKYLPTMVIVSPLTNWDDPPRTVNRWTPTSHPIFFGR